jgi:RNA polymerase sigma-70 factor, ECF subfamily
LTDGSVHARGDAVQEQPPIDWHLIVNQIQSGIPAGEETLYKNLIGGARLFLRRRLGIQDVDDRVHDVFLIVVQTIRRGEIREPERLMGFVRTVLYRQLNLAISQIVAARNITAQSASMARLTVMDPTPEQQASTHEEVDAMRQELKTMKDRDLELLTRYYLREQPPERICKEMALTPAQFLVRKSRAKARLADLTQRRLSRMPFNR